MTWRSRESIFCQHLYLIIVFASLIVFGQIVGHEFVGWDDDWLIYENPTVFPATWNGVFWHLTNTHLHLYVPVVYAGWILQSWLATTNGQQGISLNPGVFHAFSLLFHIVTSLIVYRIITRLVRNQWAACAGALLYSIHPLQVEMVAWCSSQKELLGMLFGTSSIWLYVRWFQGGHRRDYALSIVALVLGILSHPLIVTVPFVLVFLARYFQNISWKVSLRSAIPLLILSILGIVLTKHAQPATTVERLPLYMRPLIAADSAAFYTMRFFWPYPLTPIYGHDPISVSQSGLLWWTWTIPVVVVAAAFLVSRKRRWLVACVVIVYFTMAPSSGIIPFEFQKLSSVADRFVCLSMFGVSLLFACFLAAPPATSTPLPSDGTSISLLWKAGATMCILSIWGALALIQCANWRNSLTLWQHAVEVTPSNSYVLGYFGRAVEQYSPGDRWVSIAAYRKSLAIRSDVYTHENLAKALWSVGQTEDAIAEFKNIIETNEITQRDGERAFFIQWALGELLLQKGATSEAVAHLKIAADMDPHHKVVARDLQIALRVAAEPQTTH